MDSNIICKTHMLVVTGSVSKYGILTGPYSKYRTRLTAHPKFGIKIGYNKLFAVLLFPVSLSPLLGLLFEAPGPKYEH